jgi:hypothetical protein
MARPRMKFQPLFVTALGEAGFTLHPNTACGLYFFQPRGDGYYHAIVINSSGTVERKYFAYAVIAFINHGYLNKDLCELQLIDDIAANRERGWTAITSGKAATEWAAALRKSAATSLEQLESHRLPQLETATREHRLAVASYLSLTDIPVSHHQESERVAEMAGVCQIPNARDLYVQAIDLILSRSRFLLPSEDFSNLSPANNVAYRCRIQLIAAHLFWSEKGRVAAFEESPIGERNLQ